MADLPPEPSWSYFSTEVTRSERICQSCPERHYISLHLHTDSVDSVKSRLAVRRVVFTTLSHDQGWSDSPESDGTYESSHTWFEIRILEPSGHERVPRQHFQSNIRGSTQPRKHKTCWDYRDANLCGMGSAQSWTGRNSSTYIARWLEQIQNGDSLQILPKAVFPMWINCVIEARIEAWFEWITPAPTSNIDTTAPFAFRPLDTTRREIRLVEIKSKEECQHGRVELAIKHTHLSDRDHTTFEALSYCWDTGSDTKMVFITDAMRCKQGPPSFIAMSIGSNLYSALVELQKNNETRTFWIDLFCIDQNNVEERGQQVALMSEIYQSAESVTIWLGETDAATEKDIMAFQDLSQFIRSGDSSVDEACKFMDNDRILLRPWFSRVWVLQEVWNIYWKARNTGKSARVTVLCGRHTISWAEILHVNRFFEWNYGHRDNHTIPSLWNTLFDTVEPQSDSAQATSKTLECVPKPRADILSIVLGTLDMRASDSRDKIFAVLSFGKETYQTMELSDLIKPDYTKTVAQVYADFTIWWIEKHRSLRILSAVQALSGHSWINVSGTHPSREYASDGSKRPTWTPWCVGHSPWQKATLGLDEACEYNACGENTVDVSLLRRCGTLGETTITLKGVIIGKISAFYPYRYKELASLFKPYSKIFGASVWNGWKIQHNIDAGGILNSSHWNCHWIPIGSESNYTAPPSSNFPCHGSPLFKTDKGAFGLRPSSAQAGDVVVALYGGKVPFILRPTASGGDYEFVGECFLEGFMHGEAFQQGEIDRIEQQFTLR